MRAEKIGIIGVGNMGEALLKGITKSGSRRGALIVSDRNRKRRDYIRRKYHIPVTHNNLKVLSSSKVIIFAVKPQDIKGVLMEIKTQKPDARNRILFISIAAGISTKYIEDLLSAKVSVIRVMPNAPALIGEGVSAVCLGKYAKVGDYRRAESLLKIMGKVVKVEENLMDKVTAISGSGPAYFFLLIKHLTNIAVRLGMDKKTAENLINYTAFGATKMVIKTKQNPEELIKRVASKRGTTEEALNVFIKKKLEKIIEEGVKAALRRAKELRQRR